MFVYIFAQYRVVEVTGSWKLTVHKVADRKCLNISTGEMLNYRSSTREVGNEVEIPSFQPDPKDIEEISELIFNLKYRYRLTFISLPDNKRYEIVITILKLILRPTYD